MNNLTVISYKFEPYFDGYFKNGEFYSKDGCLLKQKYYNGRPCINQNGKRYGISKMRKFAKRIEVQEDVLPF